ncbi:MAG: hypothetical protein IKS00_06390 [Bacteroidales bacterium]|nr:hypothetical protein [Bacteroidales bacterium]
MEIVFLAGKQNSGKTNTFSKLREQLKCNGYAESLNETIGDFCKSLSYKHQEKVWEDIKNDFVSQFNVNGKKILLFSMGDYVKEPRKIIKLCQTKGNKYESDVLVLAANTTEHPHYLVDYKIPHTLKNLEIKKVKESDETKFDSANQTSANILFNTLTK